MEMYDYEVSSVPKEKRRSLFNITVVTTGLAVAMSTLYTGQALSPGLTLGQSILATILGCLVLWVIMLLTGTIGVKTGFATAFNARRCLGVKGSRILSLIMAIPLVGWFAFQASFFGQTISLLFPDSFIFSPQVAAIWGGLLMTSTAVFGFKGLTWLSLFAFPFLYIYSIYGVYLANNTETIEALLAMVPPTKMSIGAGVTIVIGSYAVGAVNQADISRYGKSPLHNAIASLLAMVCFALAIVAGVIMIMASQAPNIMQATLVLGMGSFSLLFIMLLQWTSNDNNLYAAALAVCNLKQFEKWKVSLTLGIVSSIIAGLGIYGYFDAFLSVLGTFIPPMGGVLAIDFYLFHKNAQDSTYVDDPELPEYNKAGLVSFLGTGALTYILSKSGVNLGIDAIFSMILAALLYLSITKISQKKKLKNSL